jgi:hypothetical protein
MLLTRRPDALRHVKLANLWLLPAKKCLNCWSFLFYYLNDVIMPNIISRICEIIKKWSKK